MITKRTLIILALAASLLIPALASAQGPAKTAPLKIAVVDLQAALLKVPDGKRAKGKLERAAKAKQKELEGKKDELQKMAEEFKRQGALLTDAVRREKLEELQKREFQLRKQAFDAEQELKRKEVKMLQPISKKLEATIQKIAKAEGYQLVLHAAGVAYVVDALDITDQVIAQYGK